MEQTREARRLLMSGTVLNGRYRIESLIAQGGMGAIYQAVDCTFNSTVALKQMLVPDEGLVRAFAREARLLNSLRHASLPVVIDYLSDETGQFLIMQYIPGEDLKQVLDRTGRPFPVADVLRWADQLLDTLEYLHGHHPPIVHRDIKPHNVKLSPRGDAILLDFGLAKGATPETTGATSSVYGYTPHYAPFEQILGRGTDPRSDLYALAATLHHLLTASKPPDAMERADAIMNGNPDPLRRANELNPAVPPAIAEILYVSMALNANYRPPTAAALRAALREPSQSSLGSKRPIGDPPVPPGPLVPPHTKTGGSPATRPSGLKRAFVVVTAMVAVVCMLGWAFTGIAYLELQRRSSNSISSLQREVSTTRTALESEKKARQELATVWPVSLSELKLRNQLRDKPIGDFGTRFPRSQIRFIWIYAKLKNNLAGTKDLKGSLYVKFFHPDGSLRTGTNSPAGYTYKIDVSGTDQVDASEGWGNVDGGTYPVGTHRVELWWDGKLIGTQSFTVYEDATP